MTWQSILLSSVVYLMVMGAMYSKINKAMKKEDKNGAFVFLGSIFWPLILPAMLGSKIYHKVIRFLKWGR